MSLYMQYLCHVIALSSINYNIKYTVHLLRTKVHELAKISILKLERITKKNSYERRDYESVDEKSLS